MTLEAPPRWRTVALWAARIGGGVFFGLLGLCAAIVLGVGDPRSPWIANATAAKPSAQRSAESFRFAVLGDTQKGLSSFHRLMQDVRKESPAFYVHTGDLVSDNDEGHYRLATWAVIKSGLEAPLFVAPGNHDIKGGARFFERHVGPTEVEFTWGRIRFILVNNGAGAPDATALDRRLKAGRGPAVVFMHVPPFDPAQESFVPASGYDGVIRVLRAHKIRYVFTGHAHEYRRLQDGPTTYVCNGVGGDYDSWELDQRAFATIVEVSGASLRDRKVEVPAAHGLWDNLEHLAIGHVGEKYRRHPWFAGGTTLALLVGWLWALGFRRK